MQISGKLTEEDLKDVRRVLRPKSYWLRVIAANWYGALLLGAIIWATITGLTGSTHPNWTALAIIWLVIAGIFSWSFFKAKRANAKGRAALDAARPNWISLEPPGVTLDGPNGATSFRPWNHFKGWREGKQVLLLEMPADQIIFFSVAEMPEDEQQTVRELLRLYIKT